MIVTAVVVVPIMVALFVIVKVVGGNSGCVILREEMCLSCSNNVTVLVITEVMVVMVV